LTLTGSSSSSSSGLVIAEVETIAGGSHWGYADGTAETAQFDANSGIVVGPDGTIYVADANNCRIRAVDVDGNVSTLAGSGPTPCLGGFQDGDGAEAQFAFPSGITFGTDGNLYVADSENGAIRRVTPQGAVTTIAGSPGGLPDAGTWADGQGSVAKFNVPNGIAMAPDGTLIVADSHNNLLRRVTLDGAVSTIAGNGTRGSIDGPPDAGELNYPSSIAVDATGAIYVGGNDYRIRLVDAYGNISTAVGGDSTGTNDGPVSQATIGEYGASGLMIGPDAALYFDDAFAGKIRKLTSGVVSSVAGRGGPGYVDGPEGMAQFRVVDGLAWSSAGLVISDTGNSAIRLAGP
jgi:sugar lactone lactonase YvrE